MRVETNRPPPPGATVKILVVDDVESNRELVAQDLEDAGYAVRTCADGQECLTVASSWQPDVVLLDIQMPVLDGIATCRRLKADAQTRHIPVLFLTATRTDEESIVEGLSVGANDYIPKPYAAAVLLARVATQVTIAQQNAKLREMAMRDELTGLFSRRFLFTSLSQLVESGERGGERAVATLLIDVDHFKRVNDTLGHLEGDRVLKTVATAITSAVRQTDIVARYGGEEFVVVLPRTGAAGATAVAETVRAAIEAQCAPVTASVGAAALSLISEDGTGWRAAEDVVREALSKADAALYEAKASGRNRVVVSETDD
ncbi:MAG: diguanylate cyclase [Deltaproteobacteria bacterium]|nr:diguanylate cyclase [Deltaproteobacteria bacterium]